MRRLLLALVPAAALLVACGGGDSGVEVGSGSTRPAAGTTIAGAAEPGGSEDTLPATTEATSTPATTGGDASGVPSGWKRITVPDQGLSLAVPEAFEAPDFSKEDLGGFLDRFQQQYPGAQLPPGAAAQVAELLKLFAIDPTSGANVNVIVTPGEVPVDLLSQQAERTLAGQFGTDVAVDPITVDGRPAVQAVVDTSSSGQSAKLTQVYVSADGKTFIITITDTAGGSLGDGVRDSIRLG